MLYRKNYSDRKNSLLCIIDYNPLNPPIKEWIQKAWPILHRSSGTRSLHDMHISFKPRKPKSFQDMLVQTDISMKEKKEETCSKMYQSKIRHCP